MDEAQTIIDKISVLEPKENEVLCLHFNTNYLSMDSAKNILNYFQDYFPNNKIIGVYGVDSISVIKKEEINDCNLY